MRFEQALAELKAELHSDPAALPTMIKHMLVENKHRVTLHLSPDTALEARLVQEEAEKLSDIKKGLTDTEITALVERTKELERLQLLEDSTEAMASIPQLSLEQLDRQVECQCVCD